MAAHSAWKDLSIWHRLRIARWALAEAVKPSAGSLSALPEVRNDIARARWRHASAQKPASVASSSAIASTIPHNSDPQWMFFPNASNRPDLISLPLSCIDEVRQNAHRMRVLAVGARTEAEILSLATCGFDLANIQAIDLFSYSPTILIGDACNLPFRASSFDVVVLGWVLEFIPDFEVALAEATRVLKTGGILGLGAMRHPESTDLDYYFRTREFDNRRWNPSSARDLESFVQAAGDIQTERLFASGVEPADRDKRGDLVSILRVTK